jgi:hypothetical protein
LGLFARLGHYALWDDEAGTALTAIGIWRTGDTSAILDHNLVAYESGKDLRNLHERLMPPLPGYLAAPFIGALGRNAWVARLPFALCGFACVGLMLWWVIKSAKDSWSLIFFAVALLTNVSFFLFCRQCRYYAPAMLCSTAMAWVYVHYRDWRSQAALFSFLSLCLFASNYLNWVALWICIAVDYAIWGRKAIRLKTVDWGILIIPQLVVGGAIFAVWNPFTILSGSEKYPEAGKLLYLWWCARDVVACEFISPIVVIVGVILAWRKLRSRRRKSALVPSYEKSAPTYVGGYRSGESPEADYRDCSWLFRASVCLIVYIVALSLLVQRPPSLRGVAAVRYFTPIIPLFIGISVLTLAELYRRWKWMAVALAAVTFSSNLPNGGPLLPMGWQSTVVKYARELTQPPGDPFAAAVEWIQQNIRENESVWVVPDYATYPLMYHAPAPVYAWQLTWPPAKEEFKSLPPVHFIGREAPQYIVAFGPANNLARESIASWNRPEIQYSLVATLDFFWKDMHRPELFWRTFEPITTYNRQSEAIYVFKLGTR